MALKSRIVVALSLGAAGVTCAGIILLRGQTEPRPASTPTDNLAARVQSFYQNYSQNPSASARRPYLTSALAAQFDARTIKGDPVLCSSFLPTQVSAGSPRSAGELTVISVTEQFLGHSSQSIDVSVQPATGLIASIQCPNH